MKKPAQFWVKINTVSGEKWGDGLSQDPQNYVFLPAQLWFDGCNVEIGKVRHFVAMTLGKCYTIEEQIDPESNVGGIQIEAIPMKKEAYEELKVALHRCRAKLFLHAQLGLRAFPGRVLLLSL